jgi:hypothetical protein
MPYTSNIQLQQLPPWLESISKSMAERAQGLSQAAYRPYEGRRLAEPNQDIRRAETLGRQEGLYLPYLNAAQPFPQFSQEYMNPYMSAVTDRLRNEGLRTFHEGILPSLESTFVRRGTYGGSMHRRLAERAARDVQQSIADRQQQALASGYQQAAQTFASDRARQLQAARETSQLGQLRQAGQLADIAALESQGERARGLSQQGLDIGYRDYLRQHEYPWSQISNLSGTISGAPHSSQGMQYLHTPPEPQWNRAGQIGQLAGQLYGLNRMTGNQGFKKGGNVTKGLEMRSGLASITKKKKKRSK